MPLILILAVLPMVVHLKIVSTGLENYPWFPDESSSLGKMLAAPGQELSFRFGESKKNPVYMAFYNPNYAAIYIVMVLPLLLYLVLDSRKKWQKGICTAEILLLLVCLKKTSSRASLVTLLLLAVGWIFLRMIKKQWWKGLGILSAVLLAAVVLFFWKNGFTYVTLYGKADSLTVADACGLEGYERLFGERMYIWSRTLPLLKNHIFLGCGPDTFALEFPQNDQLGRINTNRSLYEEILTKPHSLYLQTALQTGIVSLLCILGFWLSYFIRVFVLSKEKNVGYSMKFALAFSVAGYLIMGLVNDSMTVTAPIFWVLLGVGSAWSFIDHD